MSRRQSAGICTGALQLFSGSESLLSHAYNAVLDQFAGEGQQISLTGRFIDLVFSMNSSGQCLDSLWLFKQLPDTSADAAYAEIQPALDTHHHNIAAHTGSDQVGVTGEQTVLANIDHENHLE